ncbi:helix-turn-helix transcriptional regulator [Vibrio fluvialis]|uniref:helix-turn-helix transcriptional regulator n=1 Tax=Vibrio fluvialis TaxID=676 RepID=UPI001302C17D|nr:helix-turn-helix transcriptional regulator [Vibrio fluvialis]EKO3390533.1 helix-turn-helix transcriptional regulator [Vibrio fluvialis]EKO3989306.1 AraC family transcriptional regulator [Vibrio fluvialis]
MNGNVSNLLTSGLLHQLNTLGLSRDRIIEKCHINRFELGRHNGRISSQSHYAILDECLPYQKQLFAHSSLEQMYSLFPELFSLCFNESSASAAVHSFVRYRALIGSCDECEVSESGDTLRVTYTDTGPNPKVSSALANFAFIRDIISQYLPDVSLKLGVRHGNQMPYSVVNEKFNTHCHFGQSENYLLIQHPDLNEANPLFNRKLYQLQKNNLDHTKQEINNSTFAHSVENLLSTLIEKDEQNCGDRTLEKVCDTLKISRWTLNKKLGIENKCFTDIYNQVRLNKAVKLLSETNKSMSEISELTFFSSQSVFSRFFRTHTNMSPVQYRKSLQQG